MGKRIRAFLVTAVLAGAIIGFAVAFLNGDPKGGPSIDDYQSGLTALLFSVLVFIVTYSVREAWWNDWIGRFIVSHMLAVGLLCVPFILAVFFTLSRFDNDVAAWVLLGVFYIDAAILLLGTILWLHTSLQYKRRRREAKANGLVVIGPDAVAALDGSEITWRGEIYKLAQSEGPE